MNSNLKVDLTTCADEPIHIPGSVQPHGALIIFDDDLRVSQVSSNISEFIGRDLSELIGKPLPAELFPERALELILKDANSRSEDRTAPDLLNPILKDDLEVTVHHHLGSWFAEITRSTPTAFSEAAFARLYQQALTRLMGSDDIEELLDVAVEQIRYFSGIDRVMAYRFLPDGHGQVVAEACRDGIGRYLGLHYPANDIPSQARRLYSLHPLRLITDVAARPAPLEPINHPRTNAPADMSLTTIRSVSPIHCEYLTNMGVRGSMSVSIMVNGQLWGLIACHHYSPLQLPFGVRLTSTLIGQTLGVMLAKKEGEAHQQRIHEGHELIRQVMNTVDRTGDVLSGLDRVTDQLLDLTCADGMAVSLNARLITAGETPSAEWIADFIAWLGSREPVVTDRLGEIYGQDGEVPSSACGVLSFPYHGSDNGQLLFFRKEFKETVNWAGNPRDGVKVGPLGTRLTPRGSFALFQETTQGQSRDWSEVDVALARHLGERLTQRVLEWTSEQDRLRNLLVGIVGHDLRTPLGAIRMGAELLGEENPIARRLASSSHRMMGLVESLLDLNQIQSDRGLGIRHERFDLHEVCRNLAGEARMAFPGTKITTSFWGLPHVEADRMRIQQAVSNLLSNARHHGEVGRDITLEVMDGPGDSVEISVHNWGTPIAPEIRETLFKPYQGVQRRADRRSGGLGIGLYITHSIIQLHGGTVSVNSDTERGTTFTLLLPRAAQRRASLD